MPDASLTLVRRFRAPPQRVFEACTSPESLGRWLGPHAFTVTHVESDPRPGGRLFFRMTGPIGTVAVEATFREVVPPRRIRLDWRWTEGPPEAPPQDVTSTVTFDIAPEGEGSRLTLTHAGYVDSPDATTHAQGWAEALEKLDLLMEDRS